MASPFAISSQSSRFMTGTARLTARGHESNENRTATSKSECMLAIDRDRLGRHRNTRRFVGHECEMVRMQELVDDLVVVELVDREMLVQLADGHRGAVAELPDIFGEPAQIVEERFVA